MKLVLRVFDDETGKEIEERDLELESIDQVSTAIDEVVLRDGQSMTADWNAGKDKGFLSKLLGDE